MNTYNLSTLTHLTFLSFRFLYIFFSSHTIYLSHLSLIFILFIFHTIYILVVKNHFSIHNRISVRVVCDWSESPDLISRMPKKRVVFFHHCNYGLIILLLIKGLIKVNYFFCYPVFWSWTLIKKQYHHIFLTLIS